MASESCAQELPWAQITGGMWQRAKRLHSLGQNGTARERGNRDPERTWQVCRSGLLEPATPDYALLRRTHSASQVSKSRLGADGV